MEIIAIILFIVAMDIYDLRRNSRNNKSLKPHFDKMREVIDKEKKKEETISPFTNIISSQELDDLLRKHNHIT